MHISLVLATVGRMSELYRLFDSLCAQTHQDFDTVIVDQNGDDRLHDLVLSYRSKLHLHHVRAEKRGHASANNVGLKHATGALIAFPDDDCWYPPDLLARVVRTFREHPEFDGISGREITGKWDPHAGQVGRFDLWKRHISFALFYRRSLIDGLAFDASLGVGAGTRWGSGEETDYLIRAMRRGVVFYDPSFVVGHPEWAAAPYSLPVREKAHAYGVGMGHVLRMHGYPLHFAAWQCVRPLAGAVLAVSRGQVARARYHLAIMTGRAEGFLATATPQTVSPESRQTSAGAF